MDIYNLATTASGLGACCDALYPIPIAYMLDVPKPPKGVTLLI